MQISADKGRGNKIHIKIDGEYTLTVSSDFWLSQPLHSGDEISEDEFERFRASAEDSRAFSNAVNILSHRDHSRKELKDKLLRNYGEESSERAVERLEDMGYIDDENYARRLAKEFCERRGMSPRRISQELRRRGVDSDIIRGAVDELDVDPKEAILELLDTKFASKLSDPAGCRRVFAALQRLGYGYSDILSAMRERGAASEYDRRG